MKVEYYENQLFTVGFNWYCQKCNMVYKLNNKESEEVKPLLNQPDLLNVWVKHKAGDFSTVTDFRIEVFDDQVDFKDEASEELFHFHNDY